MVAKAAAAGDELVIADARRVGQYKEGEAVAPSAQVSSWVGWLGGWRLVGGWLFVGVSVYVPGVGGAGRLSMGVGAVVRGTQSCVWETCGPQGEWPIINSNKTS